MERQPPDASGEPGSHRHSWSVVDFLVIGDRPLMRQRCQCGAERDIPAWDRHWEPDASPKADLEGGAGRVREVP